jgi:ring-1,2-phenylacetyl-CoA epoxidase subunit PaaE
MAHDGSGSKPAGEGLTPRQGRGLLSAGVRSLGGLGALRWVREAATMVRGVGASPRPLSRRYGPAVEAGLPGERRLQVLEVRRETEGAVSVAFERPPGLSFEAGQFLTLLVPVGGGGVVPRSYSLSSTPAEGEPLVVTVKRVPGGVGSGYVHERLRAGQVVRARGPSGSFTYRPGGGAGRLLLVGGGSGITPLMGIARTALASSPGVRIELLYANRSAPDVIFAGALAALADGERLRVTHFLEAPGGALPHRAGRVGRADLAEALGRGGAGEGDAIYLCGPGPMMREVLASFTSLGVPAGRVRVEHFHSAPAAAEGASLAPRRLEVLGRQVAVAPGQTLLEAAVAASVPLDYSCTMGGCGACAVRLVRGEVVLDEPNCLSEAERSANVILACVARPCTDVAVEPLGPSASPALAAPGPPTPETSVPWP